MIGIREGNFGKNLNSKGRKKAGKRIPREQSGYGIINKDILLRELTKDNPLPKKKIAELAGSKAKLDRTKINVVNKWVKKDDFQAELEILREQQKIRVMKRIREVEKRVDYDKLAITQDKLCNFMMQNEKLLHESVKSSSEENREEKNKVDNEISKLSTNELLSKLEKLNGQDPVIDGVIVKD
jgi:hypothetical protein